MYKHETCIILTHDMQQEISTHMGHIRTHMGHIRTHVGHIRTYMGHIRTHDMQQEIRGRNRLGSKRRKAARSASAGVILGHMWDILGHTWDIYGTY